MNETFLIITGVFVVSTIIQIACGGHNDVGIIGFTTFSSVFISVIMLFISGFAPTGKDIVEVKSATNTKINDELVIQAEGFPTQVISDIRFIDKVVQVRKITKQNAWGGNMDTTYQVEKIN